MRFCTSCGAPTGGAGKKFCTKCGAPLPEEPAAETHTALTDVLPEPPREPPVTQQTPASPPAVLVEPPATAAEPPTVFAPPPSAAEPPTVAADRPAFTSPPRSWPPAQSAAGGAAAPPPYLAPPPQAPGYDAGGWPPAQPSGQDTGGWPPAQPSGQDTGGWPPAQPSGQAPGYDTGGWPRTQPPRQDFPPGGPGQPGPPYRSRPDHTAAWIGFAVAVVLVLAAGGLAAWKFLGHHGTNHPAASSSRTPNQAHSSPPPSSPTPPATSPTPSVPAGTFTVAVAPSVAAQSGEQQAVSFLQSYFAAINAHNYAKYAALVEPSQRPTLAQFQGGYSSTADSAATLTGLTPTGTGVAATVKFTSHQSPSESPTGTGCTMWRITLFLKPHGVGYRIGPVAPGYHAHYRAC
jgi:hypothetical protein